MSLDVELILDSHVSYDNCQTWEEDFVVVYKNNITHNLNVMAELAFIYKQIWRPEEIFVTHAWQIIDDLKLAIIHLKESPRSFQSLNPDNGWGTYEVFLSFVSNYLDACIKYPNARIWVCR